MTSGYISFFSTINARIFAVVEKYIIFALELCDPTARRGHEEVKQTVIVTNKLF